MIYLTETICSEAAEQGGRWAAYTRPPWFSVGNYALAAVPKTGQGSTLAKAGCSLGEVSLGACAHRRASKTAKQTGQAAWTSTWSTEQEYCARQQHAGQFSRELGDGLARWFCATGHLANQC